MENIALMIENKRLSTGITKIDFWKSIKISRHAENLPR